MSIDLGLLVLRLVVGLLMAGHGAQKLFGWFGGHGMKKFTGLIASMGLKPAGLWALLAGWGEFGGGLLFAIGLLNPLGAVGIIGAMLMAIVKVTWKKGLWGQNGGIETSLIYSAIAAVVGLVGSGAYSVDALIGLALPTTILFIVGVIGAIGITGIGAAATPAQAPKQTTS